MFVCGAGSWNLNKADMGEEEDMGESDRTLRGEGELEKFERSDLLSSGTFNLRFICGDDSGVVAVICGAVLCRL